MLLDVDSNDPWSVTIGLLSLPPSAHSVVLGYGDHGASRNVTVGLKGVNPEPLVRVVERPSRSTAVVDWRDSTTCCYREQMWVATRARLTGRCALSGASILIGDAIFRPGAARPAPRNLSAMILSVVLEANAPLLDDRDFLPRFGAAVVSYLRDFGFDRDA